MPILFGEVMLPMLEQRNSMILLQHVLICLFVSLQDIPQYDSGVDALQRLISF